MRSPAISSQRSSDAGTKTEVLRYFAQLGSPRLLVAAALVATVVRIGLGNWGATDALVIAATIILTGPVEWGIHLTLLHAPEGSIRMRHIGTGRGHKNHHRDPTDLRWLLLSLLDAAIFLPTVALFTAAWSIPLLLALNGPVLLPSLTAVAAAWIGLCHYEWTHLLVHSRYRPKTRYYARLAGNHRLHHYRNEQYWLGVTSSSGDRLMGTLPKTKGDVPVSETARTLGALTE